jgi:hypothetical protein
MKLLYTLLFAFSFSTFAYCDEIIWDEDKIISTGYTKSGEYVVNKETYRRAIKDCEYLGILNNKIYYKKKKRIGEIKCVESTSILSDFSTNIPINCYESTLPNNFHLAIAGQNLIAFKKEYYRGVMVSALGYATIIYGYSKGEDLIGIGSGIMLIGNLMSLTSFSSAGKAGEELMETAEIARYNKSSEKIE